MRRQYLILTEKDLRKFRDKKKNVIVIQTSR